MQEFMSHSCVSSSPGCFVPVTVFLLGKQELWIPACAGMTKKAPSPGGTFGTAGLSHGGERQIASFG